VPVIVEPPCRLSSSAHVYVCPCRLPYGLDRFGAKLVP